MIIRGTPDNIELFVCVDNETSDYLHQQGFYPAYIDNKGVYYKKTEDILQCIQNRRGET